MSSEHSTGSESATYTVTRGERTKLPTSPCSVVWSKGHAYVLESGGGRCRWVGCDDRGRPLALTHAELQRRGWTLTRAS